VPTYCTSAAGHGLDRGLAMLGYDRDVLAPVTAGIIHRRARRSTAIHQHRHAGDARIDRKAAEPIRP